VAGVEPERATGPVLKLSRRGLVGSSRLDPSHPAFVTSEVLTLNHAAQSGRDAPDQLVISEIAGLVAERDGDPASVVDSIEFDGYADGAAMRCNRAARLAPSC